jgi:hypothetical protein
MKTRNVARISASLTVGTLGLLPSAVPAQGAEQKPGPTAAEAVCSLPAHVRLHLEELKALAVAPPCDLTGRALEVHGIEVRVPPRGRGVYVEEYYGNAESIEAAVRHEPDGRITELESHHGEQTADGGGGGSDGCGQSSWATYQWPVYDGYWWYYNRGAAPTTDLDGYAAAIDAAGNTWNNVSNPCGVPDYSSKYQVHFMDDSSLWPGVTSLGCGSSDGYNVVGWGNLTSSISGRIVLGRACKWEGAGGYLGEADIKLNWNQPWTTSLDGCSNRWHLQSVATHEFGHVFGLGHVSESSNPDLTMSPNINGRCQKTESDLGRGDANGFNVL